MEQVDGVQKLKNDLDTVMERVQLCREIMLESPGIQYDETLAGVVGFLEACRDRMGELIEAGTQGELTEELFERCLTVNDAVCRTLEAERTGVKLPVKEGAEAAGAEPAKSTQLLDLGEENEDEEADAQRPVRKVAAPAVGSPPQKAFSKPKAAQEDSLLAPYVPPPPPAAPAAVAAAAAPAAQPAATATASVVDPFAGSGDAFADFGAAPAAAAAAPAASSSAALGDLETLLATTSVSPPPAPAAPAAAAPASSTVQSQAQAAAEFDAFLDSLGGPAK